MIRRTLLSIGAVAGLLLCSAAAPAQAQFQLNIKQNLQPATPAAEAAVAELHTEIAQLREAQERFFAAQGRYTEDVRELTGYVPSSRHSVVLVTASALEWAAVGTVPDVLGALITRVRRVATQENSPQP